MLCAWVKMYLNDKVANIMTDLFSWLESECLYFHFMFLDCYKTFNKAYIYYIFLY